MTLRLNDLTSSIGAMQLMQVLLHNSSKTHLNVLRAIVWGPLIIYAHPLHAISQSLF